MLALGLAAGALLRTAARVFGAVDGGHPPLSWSLAGALVLLVPLAALLAVRRDGTVAALGAGYLLRVTPSALALLLG